MAFSPVNQVIIAWRGTGDREMWTIDPQTGDEVSITSSFHLGFVNLEQTQGASVSYDSVTQTETLHVLVRDNGQSYVYEVDMATGSASNPVGPITGDFTRPASLAIDPSDGTWYVTKDTETRQLATLDPITAVVTTVVTIAGDPDAEGLEFADDGEIYLEEDRGSLGGRNIYQVDRTTGALTVATQTIPGSGDIEGLSCNANSTLILDPCAVVGQGNGGQGSGQIVDVSANSGDEVIAQIVLREGSSTFVYNSSSAFIRSSSNAPVLLKSAVLLSAEATFSSMSSISPAPMLETSAIHRESPVSTHRRTEPRSTPTTSGSGRRWREFSTAPSCATTSIMTLWFRQARRSAPTSM